MYCYVQAPRACGAEGVNVTRNRIVRLVWSCPDRKGAVGKDRRKSGGASLRPEAPNEPGVERRTKWKPLLVLR